MRTISYTETGQVVISGKPVFKNIDDSYMSDGLIFYLYNTKVTDSGGTTYEQFTYSGKGGVFYLTELS